MSCRTTQIVVQFHEPPHMLFPNGPRRAVESNRLVVQVQPAEGSSCILKRRCPTRG